MSAEYPMLVLPAHVTILSERGESMPTRTSISLDIARTAFLIIDVYGITRIAESAEPGAEVPSFGASADRQRHMVFERIVPAREAARALGLPVVYCTNSAPHVALEQYSFWEQRTRNSAFRAADLFRSPLTNVWEYEAGDCPTIRIDPDAAPHSEDIVVRKIVYSGFADTYLDTLLRNLEIKTLIVSGFSATECVLATAIDALQHGFEVVLLRDGTTGAELPEDLQAGRSFSDYVVGWMETFVGHGVETVDFLRACAALRQTPAGADGSRDQL